MEILVCLKTSITKLTKSISLNHRIQEMVTLQAQSLTHEVSSQCQPGKNFSLLSLSSDHWDALSKSCLSKEVLRAEHLASGCRYITIGFTVWNIFLLFEYNLAYSVFQIIISATGSRLNFHSFWRRQIWPRKTLQCGYYSH